MNETIEMSGQTVGEIVALDYRAADVFEKMKIDFCCQGNRLLKDVCEEKQIPIADVLTELESALNFNKSKIDYQSWSLDVLATHIQTTHHGYVEKQIPILKQYLRKICDVHGDKHPELHEIEKLFNESAGEFTLHMKKEEMMLFPFIRRMVNAQERGEKVESPQFGTIENPVEMMMHDHTAEGERFRKIFELSSGYTPPEDGCNTYKVTYALLKEFEEDMHLHIHLENNILFPKSIELEKLINK